MEQLLIGALLTVVVGGAAALITAQLEHRRWVRQERLENWTTLVTLFTDFSIRASGLVADLLNAARPDAEVVKDRFEAEFSDTVSKITATYSRSQLLGPNRLMKQLEVLLRATLAVLGATDDEQVSARLEVVDGLTDSFVAAARKALGSD